MYHTFDLSHIIHLNVMMAWYFWGPRPPLDQMWEGVPLCVKGWDKKCKFASWVLARAGHNPRPCLKRPGHVWVTPSWWKMAPLGNPLAPCLCFLVPSFTPYNNFGPTKGRRQNYSLEWNQVSERRSNFLKLVKCSLGQYIFHFTALLFLGNPNLGNVYSANIYWW